MPVDDTFYNSQAKPMALFSDRFELIEYLEYFFHVFRCNTYSIIFYAINDLIAFSFAGYTYQARPVRGKEFDSIAQKV